MKFISALLISFLVATNIVEARPLKIVGTEWPPYDMLIDGAPSGLAMEITINVLEKMDIEYEIQFLPWKRALIYTKSGEADALFGVSKKVEREKFLIYPTTPVHNSKYVFFIKKGNEQKLSLSSYLNLKGHIVGITNGYSYTEEFWNYIKAYNNYSSVITDIQNLHMLALSRIDYFPCDLANGIYLAKKDGIHDEITYLPFIISEKNYYLAFSKKSNFPRLHQIAAEYNEILIQFKNSADYKKILDNHLN